MAILIAGKKIEKKKYYLSICAIFKDESKYFREWLEYHLLVGVEHFYLYNNLSDDNYLLVLQPYIDAGLVTLIDWPLAKQAQSSAYKDCFEHRQNETSWLAFIDLDEFIVPRYEASLKDWLKPYEKYPSIIIYWKMFGTAAKIEASENSLVTESYTCCFAKFVDSFKSIVNTSYDISDFSNAHMFCSCIGNFRLWPFNEFKKSLWHYRLKRWPLGNKQYSIQLNHYWSKSYGEYKNRQVRGAVNVSKYDYDNFLKKELLCTAYDFTIFRYVTMLKINMMNKAEVNHNNI
jgi:hypothetical protein